MSAFCKNLLHSWINSFSSDEFCFSGKKGDDSKEEIKEEDENKDLSQEHVVNERKRNTDIYDYIHQFMDLSQTPDVSPEIIHEEAYKLMQKLEPYCASVILPAGERIFIRPIFPTDMFTMKNYIETGEISQHSLSLRFNSVVTKVLDSSLEYLCNVNFDTHFGIGVLMKEDGEWKGIASGRFIQDVTHPDEAEWAALVVDKKHGHKVGSCILYYLSIMAKQFGINKLMAVVHPENHCVRYWMTKLKAYRLFQNECDFWVFDTPIYKEWIKSDEARIELEKGGKCENVLSDELKELLLSNIMGLSTYKKANKNDQSLLNSRKE